MREEPGVVSLSALRFLIQHPWLFISPIVIIMSMVTAQLSTLELKYECKALISFEVPAGRISGDKASAAVRSTIGDIYLSKNLSMVVKEVWPNVSEQSEPLKFNALKDLLMKSVRVNTDKLRQEVIAVSYTSTDPKQCYKIVSSTINVIKKINKEKTEEGIESSLTFLKKQLEFYKNKLEEINKEMADITVELKKRYMDLTPDERYLIDNIMTSSQIRDAVNEQTQAGQIVGYSQRVTDLQLARIELQRRQELLEAKLKGGDLSSLTASTQSLDDDPFVKQFTSAIAMKELARSGMIAQGFMPEHPGVVQAENEIARLKDLRNNRITELVQSPGMSSEMKSAIEENLRRQILDVKNQIEIIEIKISTLEGYKKTSAGEVNPVATFSNPVSARTSRLLELRNEKDINQRYYQDLRKQLEETEIKNRLEKEEAGLKMNVIEEPKMPIRPLPLQKEKKIILGLMMGIIAGAALAYFVDSLDSSIKSSSELRELLQVPVLASIDRINTLQDIRIIQVRRHLIIIGLVAFVVLSKLILKALTQFQLF